MLKLIALPEVESWTVPTFSLFPNNIKSSALSRLFALSDHIEQRVAVGQERADRLTQAILAKAFRGELVPTEAELARREGRSYEPAGMLVERIKAEIVREGGKGKRK
jgi:hypothetical protein